MPKIVVETTAPDVPIQSAALCMKNKKCRLRLFSRLRPFAFSRSNI